MNTDLLRGRLVRLSATNMEEVGPHYYRWGLDPQFYRLTESDPYYPFSLKAIRSMNENDWAPDDVHNVMFTIRALADDQIIGFADLDYINYHFGDSYMGLGLGDRAFHGKGYGADAMDLLLGYAFLELNLHRVTLSVFEYNQNAIRLYERTGFSLEGRHRQCFYRAGRRWDLLLMGILRREWLARAEKEG